MFDLIATIASTVVDALSATDVSKWRGDHQEQDSATAVFMLHLRLVEILESGHKVFVSLQADLGNHDRSKTFVTGPVPPFYVGKSFLGDVARQRLNLSRLLVALRHIRAAGEAFDTQTRLILTPHGLGKHDPLDLVMETLEKGRMPLYVPEAGEWLRAEAARRGFSSRALKKLIGSVNARVLDLRSGWTTETATLLRWYIEGGDAQRQLTRLSAAAERLQRILLDNFELRELLASFLRPVSGSDAIHARSLLR